MNVPRTLLILTLAAAALLAEVKQFKPSRFNLFSPQQDVEMGKEAAAEVRKNTPVVNNAEVTAYVQRVGSRLTKSKQAAAFPFTFEVVNDPSINAFALPGGPMFIHTGLLSALDNESQLAGVMAHEMSHVILRHGTSQVSKANLVQLPAMLGASALGNKGGLWGTLGQLGVGLGAQSVLLSYSRDAEQQADLNGAQIMNEVGYDPTQMAKFFEKLQTQGGTAGDTRLANFLSDHPTPGNRVKYVEDQNKSLPKVAYRESAPDDLPRVKQLVAALPPPPKPAPAATAAAGQGTPPSAAVHPSGRYKTHQGRDFSLDYPDNWDVVGDAQSPTVTVSPKTTLVADKNGQSQVGYGFIAAYYYPQDGKPNLQRDTAALVKQVISQNPTMQQTGQGRSVRVSGLPAMLTPLRSASPYKGQQRETDMLLTLARPEGLFYVVFIAPETEWSATQPAFDRVVSSLRFSN